MPEINEGVRYVQNRLNRGGFGPLNEDGIWGDRTKAAFDRAVIPPANSAPDDVDPILFKQLQRDEGCRLRAYPDPLSPRARTGKGPGDPWTIGYGHTGRDVYEGLVWTQPQADQALVSDIIAHNDVLAQVLPWVGGLDAPRRRVLQNMHFNMGWDNPRTPALEGLAGFVNTLAKIKAGDYAGAAGNMVQSKWYGQVGDRSKRLVATMKDGQDR